MMIEGLKHRIRAAGRRPRSPNEATLAALAFGIAALSTSANPASADERPHYDGFRQGTYLSYLNAGEDGAEITRSPRLGLSFGDEVRPVLMDTGSTGIVVSASRIPGFETMPSRPGRLTYSSSGRIMIGRWVTLPVTLVGGNGASVTTSPLPVLAVTEIACTNNARACTPETMPGHVAMLGIGFGREGDSQSQSTPDTNPLLNLAPDGRSPARRGYVVTRDGIHAGLTGANTRGGIRFVKLDPHPDIPGEWQGVPVCITVNGQAPGACGRALVDTGVSAMYLTLPTGAVDGAVTSDDDGRSQFLPGTRLGFTFPGRGSEPAAAYDIVIGDESRLSPGKVTLNTRRPEPFVNTGLRFLNGFDVLYDADGGYFGFRKR
ncbi:hypothetical protein [Methylobacterium sp.]|uniref:hypothetical protein n=1 Tax=Methylobacterium sp. TaxID=409 RepID=UPI003C773E95